MADLQTKRVPIAKYGINLVDNAVDSNGRFTPYMKNFHLEGGMLKKFSGYTKFPESHGTDAGGNARFEGFILGAMGDSEQGRRLYEFTNANGYIYLVAITNKHAFAFDMDSSNGSRFRCISPGTVIHNCASGWTDAHADITASHPANDYRLRLKADTDVTSDSAKLAYVNITSKDLTGYSKIGLWISCYGDINPLYLQLVVSESADGAKSGTYVTLTPPSFTNAAANRYFVVLSGDFSSLDAVVSLGIWNNNADWTDGDYVKIDSINAITEMDNAEEYIALAKANDTDMFDTGNALVLSNESEDLYFWDASHTLPMNNPFETLVHTMSTFSYCRELAEFYNYFMFANFVTGGGQYRQSIEHSGVGDIDDHTSVSSGNYWLSDAVGKILRVIKIENALVIFCERAILRGDYYGGATKFAFRILTSSFGAISSNAICMVGNAVFFIGSDRRFYSFSLGSMFQEVGRPVSESLFSFGWGTTTEIWRVRYDDYNKRVYFFATTGNRFVGYAFNLKGPEPLWEHYYFPDEASASDEVNMADLLSTTAIMFEGANSKQNPELATLFITESGPSGHGARVYRLHNTDDVNTAFLADESEIDCEYQTEDISINDEFEYSRWQEFLFTAKSSLSGSSVIVQYSIDNGDNWTDVDESPIYLEDNEWKTYLVHFDIVSRVIRLRFTNTAKDLQVKDDMFINYLPEGEKEVV